MQIIQHSISHFTMKTLTNDSIYSFEFYMAVDQNSLENEDNRIYQIKSINYRNRDIYIEEAVLSIELTGKINCNMFMCKIWRDVRKKAVYNMKELYSNNSTIDLSRILNDLIEECFI